MVVNSLEFIISLHNSQHEGRRKRIWGGRTDGHFGGLTVKWQTGGTPKWYEMEDKDWKTGTDTNSLMSVWMRGVEDVHTVWVINVKWKAGGRCGNGMIRRIQMIMLISARSEIHKLSRVSNFSWNLLAAATISFSTATIDWDSEYILSLWPAGPQPTHDCDSHTAIMTDRHNHAVSLALFMFLL